MVQAIEKKVEQIEQDVNSLRIDHEICKTGTTKDIQRIDEKVENVLDQNEKIIVTQNRHTNLLETLAQSRNAGKDWIAIIARIGGALLIAALTWFVSQAIK